MWDDLVCPFDLGILEGASDWLTCHVCGRGFPVENDIPTLLPPEDSYAWRTHQRQRLQISQGEHDRVSVVRSQQVRERAERLELFLDRFGGLSAAARLLQVGAWGEAEVHHLAAAKRYVVDPLAGELAEQGRLSRDGVEWIGACGELLPFASGSFDAALLCDLLVDVDSPSAVLRETARCLRPDGLLWLTCHVRAESWLDRVKRVCRRPGLPENLPWRFTERHLLELCQQAGLQVVWEGWHGVESIDLPERLQRAQALSDLRT